MVKVGNVEIYFPPARQVRSSLRQVLPENSTAEDSLFSSLPVDSSNQDLGYIIERNPSLFLPPAVYQYFKDNGIEIKFEQQVNGGRDTYWLIGESERYTFQIALTHLDNTTVEVSFINFVDHEIERRLIRNPSITRTGTGGTEALISGLRRIGFNRFKFSPVTRRLSNFYQRLGTSLGGQVSVGSEGDVIIDFGQRSVMAPPRSDRPIIAPESRPRIVDVQDPSTIDNIIGARNVDAYLQRAREQLSQGETSSWLLVNFDLRAVNHDFLSVVGDQYLREARAAIEDICLRYGATGNILVVREGPNFAVNLPESADREGIFREIRERFFEEGIRVSRDAVDAQGQRTITITDAGGRALIFDLRPGRNYSEADLRFALRQAERRANNNESIGQSYVADQAELAAYRPEVRMPGYQPNIDIPWARGLDPAMIDSATGLPNVRALEADLAAVLRGIPRITYSEPGAYLSVYRHGAGSDELYALIEVVDASGNRSWYLLSFDGNKISTFRQYGLAGEGIIDNYLAQNLVRAALSAQGQTAEGLLADFQARAGEPFKYRFTPEELRTYNIPQELVLRTETINGQTWAVVDVSRLPRQINDGSGRLISGFSFTGAVIALGQVSSLRTEQIIGQIRKQADVVKATNPEREPLFRLVDAQGKSLAEIRPASAVDHFSATLVPEPVQTVDPLLAQLEGIPNLTPEQRTSLTGLARENGFTQIIIPEEMRGQQINFEALEEFVSKPRPEGSRVLLIATPENFYSIGGAGFEGLRVEISQDRYRFIDGNGTEIASYKLNEGFNLEQVSNNGSSLARRLERDISRQARQIEFKIMGPFYQKLITNQQFANRVARALTEASTLGVGLLGSHAVAAVLDEFGVEMPALRFVLEFGGFDLTARVFSRFMGLPNHGFVQGLAGLGQLRWGSAFWQTALQLTGLNDTFLASEIPSLGAGILASRMIFNRYLINPDGIAGKILARAGIYAMLNQVVTETGVWIADKLTNGGAGQTFDESARIAAAQHPTLFTIGSSTIGRVYTSMLIDLFTDSRADYEAEMGDYSQRVEAATQQVFDKLSAVFLTYSAAHPRSFGEVPDLPEISLNGPTVGTLDSDYYDGLVEALRGAFSKEEVQNVVAGIIALDNANYTGTAMSNLRECFDDSGHLVDPDRLISMLRSRNLAEVMRIEQQWRQYFAYEMFLKLAAGGDLTPYRNQGWITESGEIDYENEDVLAGLSLFEEEQRQWIQGRMQELIARQSMGSELPDNPLDWALGLTTLGDRGQFVINTASIYYQPAVMALGTPPTPSSVVAAVINGALVASPEELSNWLEGQNIDQTTESWNAALSQESMGALADANNHRGGGNLQNRMAIGLFRLLYLRALRETPGSPAVEILGAYLQALEGKETLDLSWINKAEREYTLFGQIIGGSLTPEAQLRLNALCLRTSLLTGLNN